MASQQVLFGETVAAMKKALKRTAYESDSDNEIEHYTNRGNKLKKRARFAHQGLLIPPSGPEAYRQNVEYAGQNRTVISRNPVIVDDEGFEIDSEDDEDDERVQDAIASAAELNPYANIRLEQLLAPLTASTDLPTHTTLSKPFTSKTLADLADQSCEVMRKENRSLWHIRHLFTRLTGDHTWAPCGMMVGPDDLSLFSDAIFDLKEADAAGTAVNGTSHIAPGPSEAMTNEETHTSTVSNKAGPEDVVMGSSQINGTMKPEPADSDKITERHEVETEQHSLESEKNHFEKRINGGGEKGVCAAAAQEDPSGKAPGNRSEVEDTEMREGDNTERGAELPLANGDDAGSATSQLGVDQFIHPLFLPPPNAETDRGGLSEAEADEMRRLVALYVQKQEEVCRGAHKLHEGLLKAERLRQTVLRWSKFEAHCGPNRDMSDGEDWYDKEEWGLTEDLKKGQDEEEEETGTATKKTRNRR